MIFSSKFNFNQLTGENQEKALKQKNSAHSDRVSLLLKLYNIY